MKYSIAKEILRRIYALPADHSWEDLKAVYDTFDHHFPKETGKLCISPWYNRFTSQLQVHRLKSAPIGYRDVLYYDSCEKNGAVPWKMFRGKVTTWMGKQVGHVVNIAKWTSYGYCITKRVSITFQLRGMIFRGICSYENMDCFRVKRVK